MPEPQAKSQTRRAQNELREQILSGALAAGTRLYEMAIASALDVSRTPAREAMSRLVEEGLLERHRSGGFRVRSFSLSDVRDAIELRGALEGIAGRLAADRRPDDAELAAIRDTVRRLDACFGSRIDEVDFDAYADANAAFHAALAELSGSTIIRLELDRVTSLPFASPSAFVGGSSHSAAFRRSLFIAQEQHREIVEAIAAGEGLRAEMLAREHARAARRNFDHALGDGAAGGGLPGMALIVN